MAFDNVLDVGGSVGTTFGKDSSAKVSVYGVTPVVQASHIADATDAATAITKLNAVLVALENFGIVASA